VKSVARELIPFVAFESAIDPLKLVHNPCRHDGRSKAVYQQSWSQGTLLRSTLRFFPSGGRNMARTKGVRSGVAVRCERCGWKGCNETIMATLHPTTVAYGLRCTNSWMCHCPVNAALIILMYSHHTTVDNERTLVVEVAADRCAFLDLPEDIVTKLCKGFIIILMSTWSDWLEWKMYNDRKSTRSESRGKKCRCRVLLFLQGDPKGKPLPNDKRSY